MAKPVKEIPVPPLTKKHAVIASFEGVIASSAWRKHWYGKDYEGWAALTAYDQPNPAFVEAMQTIADDVKLIIYADVQTVDKLIVEDWLAAHNVQYFMLHCRFNNNFHERDTVKATLYKQMTKASFNVGLVLENDPACWEMWHALGLQVKFITDPELPDTLPDSDAVLDAIPVTAPRSNTSIFTQECYTWLYPTPNTLRCQLPAGHTGPHYDERQCTVTSYGAKCMRRKHTNVSSADTERHSYELLEECRNPLGNDARCNLSKGHPGKCLWSSLIDNRRKDDATKLAAEKAVKEEREQVMRDISDATPMGPAIIQGPGPIALGSLPAPIAEPTTNGEVLAPIIELCGHKDGEKICIRAARHDGPCAFADPDVSSDEKDLQMVMDWNYWGC